MKLLNKQKNTWKQINEVILAVNNTEVNYEKDIELSLNCNFENISRGRCIVEVLKKQKKSINSLFVHTDKPLMKVKVFYTSKEIDKLIGLLHLNKNNNKKVKISLKISNNLMINELGYLYIKDNLDLEIENFFWNIPIT